MKIMKLSFRKLWFNGSVSTIMGLLAINSLTASNGGENLEEYKLEYIKHCNKRNRVDRSSEEGSGREIEQSEIANKFLQTRPTLLVFILDSIQNGRDFDQENFNKYKKSLGVIFNDLQKITEEKMLEGYYTDLAGHYEKQIKREVKQLGESIASLSRVKSQQAQKLGLIAEKVEGIAQSMVSTTGTTEKELQDIFQRNQNYHANGSSLFSSSSSSYYSDYGATSSSPYAAGYEKLASNKSLFLSSIAIVEEASAAVLSGRKDLKREVSRNDDEIQKHQDKISTFTVLYEKSLKALKKIAENRVFFLEKADEMQRTYSQGFNSFAFNLFLLEVANLHFEQGQFLGINGRHAQSYNYPSTLAEFRKVPSFEKILDRIEKETQKSSYYDQAIKFWQEFTAQDDLPHSSSSRQN